MAEVVWGNLAKGVEDKTKISEEIDDDIKTHNEDPSAHGQENESVYEHRISEILDHLDRTVTPAKIADDKQIVRPSWESWDMLTVNTDPNADVDMQMGAVQLSHLAVAGQAAEILVEKTFDGPRFATRHPHFETIFYAGENYGSTIDIVMGSGPGDAAGWRVINDTLYAFWYDGAGEHTYELSDVYVGDNHHYVVDVLSDSEIKFYVDGEEVHHVTNAQFSSSECGCFIYLNITSTAAYVGSFRVFTTRFWQDYM